VKNGTEKRQEQDNEENRERDRHEEEEFHTSARENATAENEIERSDFFLDSDDALRAFVVGREQGRAVVAPLPYSDMINP